MPYRGSKSRIKNYLLRQMYPLYLVVIGLKHEVPNRWNVTFLEHLSKHHSKFRPLSTCLLHRPWIAKMHKWQKWELFYEDLCRFCFGQWLVSTDWIHFSDSTPTIFHDHGWSHCLKSQEFQWCHWKSRWRLFHLRHPVKVKKSVYLLRNFVVC